MTPPWPQQQGADPTFDATTTRPEDKDQEDFKIIKNQVKGVSASSQIQRPFFQFLLGQR
jgi:hypothetical protein